MQLYHGSDVIVEKPILLSHQRTLDFGAGFYTTANYEQAEVFARKVGDRRESKSCFISVYDVADFCHIKSEIISWEGLRVANENKAMLEFIVPRLIKAVMEEEKVSEKEAFTLLYSSKLYEQLDREETKLWHLSVPTLYNMFKEEQVTGKITYPEEA